MAENSSTSANNGVTPIRAENAPFFMNLPAGIDGWERGLRPDYLDSRNKELVVTNFVRIQECPKGIYEYKVVWQEMVLTNHDCEALNLPCSSTTNITNKMQKQSLNDPKCRELKLPEMRAATASLRELIQERGPMEPTNEPFVVATNNKDILWTTRRAKLSDRNPCVLSDTLDFVDNCEKRRRVGFTIHLAYSEPYDFSSHLNALHTFIGDPGQRKDPAPAAAVLNAFVALHMPTTQLPNQKLDCNGQQVLGGNRFFVRDPTDASRFAIKSKKDGPQLLYAIRGYFVSVRPGTDQLLLNINPTIGVFHHPMSVVGFMKAMDVSTGTRNESHKEAVERAHDQDKRLSGFLLNLRVKVNFERQTESLNEPSRQLKLVKGFGLSTMRQTFLSSGRSITVQEYFRTVHKVILKYPEYPCVNVGFHGRSVGKEDKAEWFPPELLDIEDNLPARSQLAHQFKDQLIRMAAQKPFQNQKFIQCDGLRQTGLTSLPHGIGPGPQNAGGFKFDQKLMHVKAQHLEPPRIRDSKPITIDNRASWNLYKRLFCDWPKGNGYKFSILYLVDTYLLTEYIDPDPEIGLVKGGLNYLRTIRKDLLGWKDPDADLQKAIERKTEMAETQPIEADKIKKIGMDMSKLNKLRERAAKFAGTFDTTLKNHGMPKSSKNTFTVTPLFMCTETAHKPETVLDHELKNYLEEQKQQKCDMVLVIKPGESFWYDRIKYLSDVVVGIKTQCVTEAVVLSSKPDALSNIIMKSNFKSGGTPFRVDANVFTTHQIDPKKLIVLGADISSIQQGGPAGINGVPNVAAVVGSLDDKLVHFGGSLRLQRARQDRVAGMKEMVVERLNAWKAKNKGKLPESMLFYRDGVSESQYVQCELEIADIQAAYQEVSQGKGLLQLTFIVVGKRHGVRFYAGSDSSPEFYDDKTQCLKPGLVVDTEITHSYCFDWYLQSHSSHQGTPRPAHYFVLTNGMQLTAKSMTAVTYAICHNYVRCSKSVSYAAPAYYADRLCNRGNVYLRAGLLSDAQLAEKWPTKGKIESDEAFYERCLKLAHSIKGEWKEAKGPWNKAVDGVMFWL